jgi:hypothetical protein
LDGKNVADFIDPDIAAKLEALEREEEKLEAAGFYASDDSMVSYVYCRVGPKLNHARRIPMTNERKRSYELP